MSEQNRCPWVETSDEGTSYCRLAEANAAEVAALKAEVVRLERTLDAVRGFAWRLTRYDDS